MKFETRKPAKTKSIDLRPGPTKAVAPLVQSSGKYTVKKHDRVPTGLNDVRQK